MMVPSVELRIALAPAVGREQPVRAHHAQHSGPSDADPVQDPQPRVHLPMTLALERRASEVRANGRQQLFVRVGRRRPAPCRLAPLPAPRPRPPCVVGRPRALPGLTHPLDPVPGVPWSRRSWRSSSRPPHRQREAARRGTGALPQQFHLHRQLPNVTLGRVQRRDRRFPSLDPFSPSSRPARARSFHASRRYSSTPTSRDTASSDSPRSSRSTTSRLRLALHRCRGARAPAPPAAASARTPVALRAPSVRADPRSLHAP